MSAWGGRKGSGLGSLGLARIPCGLRASPAAD